MVAEAVIIELLGKDKKGDVVNYTVDDAAVVPKGTIMELTDERTCVVNTAAAHPVAGIAATEKVANDGQTTIGLYTYGIFDLTISAAGSTVLGADVRMAAAGNTVTDMTSLDRESGFVIGKSLATGGVNEVVSVVVRV